MPFVDVIVKAALLVVAVAAAVVSAVAYAVSEPEDVDNKLVPFPAMSGLILKSLVGPWLLPELI